MYSEVPIKNAIWCQICNPILTISSKFLKLQTKKKPIMFASSSFKSPVATCYFIPQANSTSNYDWVHFNKASRDIICSRIRESRFTRKLFNLYTNLLEIFTLTIPPDFWNTLYFGILGFLDGRKNWSLNF
jgi:hypothetical protein